MPKDQMDLTRREQFIGEHRGLTQLHRLIDQAKTSLERRAGEEQNKSN